MERILTDHKDSKNSKKVFLVGSCGLMTDSIESLEQRRT
jgi:hypothetical protein